MGAFGRIFGRSRQVEALLKKAEEAFGQKNWTAAVSAANELRAKIDPKEFGKFSNELLRSYYLEASALRHQGKIPEALEVIDHALDQPSGLADIGRLLSEIATETPDTSVVSLLEKAEKKLPDNNHVLLALLGKYVDIGRFDESVLPLYSRMHQRAPENKQVTFGYAMTLRKLERYDRNTLSVYRKAFHEYSTNNDFLYGLARTYASQSPPMTEALPVIERALKFFPDEKSFQEARVAILSNMPALTPEQVRMLVEVYKKTRDKQLADKLVNHLLAAHADDEDACRVYEAVWRDHPKRLAMLTTLAERYRLNGRKDSDAMEVFLTFFDDMPRERDNTVYLAKRLAEKGTDDKRAILVYQQALREGAASPGLEPVVIALARGYLKTKQADEEAARVYRIAHSIQPDNFEFLSALKDVALAGGRMDGTRANPLIDFVASPNASKDEILRLTAKLGPSLAKEGRTDADALRVYRGNLMSGIITDAEEDSLVKGLLDQKEIKLSDIPLVERAAKRRDSDDLNAALAELYRESGEITPDRLPVVVKILRKNPADRKLASWMLPHLLNEHGQEEPYFPLISDLLVNGHLGHAKGIKQGVVAATTTRIARDLIREGNFRQAVDILSEAFKFESSPILQYLLGVGYQGLGDFQTGLGIFKDLLKADKENYLYKYRAGVLKLMAGNLDEAESDLDSLQSRFPNHPLVCLRKAMILEARGDHASALEEYTKIKAKDPVVSAFVDYRKGILLCAKGEFSQGHTLLDRASTAGIKSPALDAARLVASTAMADQAIDSGSLDSAETYLGPLKDTKTPPWPLVANERLLRLGLKRLIEDDEKSAMRVLDIASRTGARDSRVLGLLALMDFSAARPKASVDRLERALTARDPVGVELAHRLWVVISIRLGKHDEAREAADWLVSRNAPGAERLRFIAMWRNQLEVDWPPALKDWTYDDLEKLGFPVGLIGRMAYKRADFEGGAKYLDKYYKDTSRPDRVEAEFLLGLMYIQLKKANLGLHYWGNILSEGYKELSGKRRVDSLLLLGYHFLEHGQPEKSRDAFALAKEAGADDRIIEEAVSFSHLQAGYLSAKADNMAFAIREWEKILESAPDNWMALQNLALAHFWVGNDGESLDYFDRLFVVVEAHPESIDPESLTFLLEETRKMVNQLISLRQTDPNRAEVKREMMLDEIQEANRHYWTLGVKKGATSEGAQAHYFRLIKIYNPEKYPEDFMILEKAYVFFNKPGLLRKNEQKVFNAFHFRLLKDRETEGLTELLPSPQIIDYLKKALDPRLQVDFTALLNDSLSRKDPLPALNDSPDFACPDYLVGW
jgi:tetratricopeptide (TPR) repeat protein